MGDDCRTKEERREYDQQRYKKMREGIFGANRIGSPKKKLSQNIDYQMRLAAATEKFLAMNVPLGWEEMRNRRRG